MTDTRQPRRLRARLTLLYAGTLLGTLLVAIVTLRFAVRNTLEREFEDSVRATAGLVRQFFRTEIAEYLTIEATLTHIAGELVFEDRLIRVLQPDGTEFRPAGAPPRPAMLAGPYQQAELPLEPGLAPGWRLQVTASAAPLRALERRIDRWFLIGIPLLGLLSTFGGWWLTGRALRPVRQMADVAGRIAPASGERLPIVNPDDELGRLGTRFNALLDRLDGALSQQRRFLADAAHELRTPLARLRGRLDVAMLTEPAGAGDAPDEVLAGLQEEVARMTRLVDELMQLARVEAGGESTVQRTQLFLDDVVTDELSLWRPVAVRAGLRLRCDVLEEAPVRADGALLRRLLGILLDNAVQYSHAGGEVEVTVRRDGPQVRLVVEDHGIGIPDAERALVTERFYRGTNARAERPDGSGLGLAIAQWIVQQHGAALHFEPARPAGTRAVVTWPLVTTSDAPDAAPAGSAA